MSTLSDSEFLSASFDEHVIEELEAMHANQPSFETTHYQQQQQQQPAITCFFKSTKTGLKFTHEDDINLLKGYTERGDVDGVIARRFKKHKLPDLKERLGELMQEIVREKLSSTPSPEFPPPPTTTTTEEDEFVEAIESFDAASKQETQRDDPSTPKRSRSPETVDGATYTDPKSRFKRQHRNSNESDESDNAIDEVPEDVITEMIPFMSGAIYSPPSFAPEGAFLSTSGGVQVEQQQKTQQQQKTKRQQRPNRKEKDAAARAAARAAKAAKAAKEAVVVVVVSKPSIQLKFDYNSTKDVFADRFSVRSAFASINSMMQAQALAPKTPAAGHISFGCDEKLD